MSSWNDRIAVFFGQATVAEAYVYVRLSGDPGGLEIGGKVTGPFCRHARTLPAAVPLQNRGAAPTLLAEAMLPDPCFWIPGSPYLYEVHVDIRRGGQTVSTVRRTLGIRPLAARGKDLVLAGRRWVLRGIVRSEEAIEEIEEIEEIGVAREVGAALVVDHPSDALCAEACREGVLLVAMLREGGATAAAQLRRLAGFPAVGFVVLPDDVGQDDLDDDLEVAPAGHVILAQHFDVGESPKMSSWAQVAVCEVGNLPEFGQAAAKLHVPILAFRPMPSAAMVVARRSCDELQRQLASHGDFAGYLV